MRLPERVAHRVLVSDLLERLRIASEDAEVSDGVYAGLWDERISEHEKGAADEDS